MKLFPALAIVSTVLVSAPLLAGPPAAKRPLCQAVKSPARDVKRPEPCRKPAIPPVIDPTPLFLASALPAARSDVGQGKTS